MNYDDFGLRIEYVEYTVKKEIVYIILLKVWYYRIRFNGYQYVDNQYYLSWSSFVSTKK